MNGQEDAYKTIRGYVINAKQRVYTAVNVTMVETYWNIGKEIYEVCGENVRAAYGKQVLGYFSGKLTTEFGKGYSVQGLRNMRQFYLTFQNYSTLWSELSWSHYRLFTLPEDNMQIYAAKYMPYMPTVEELKRELKLEDFENKDRRFW